MTIYFFELLWVYRTNGDLLPYTVMPKTYLSWEYVINVCIYYKNIINPYQKSTIHVVKTLI